MKPVRGTYQQWLERIAAHGPAYGEALRPAVIEPADPARDLGPRLDADHPAFKTAWQLRRPAMPDGPIADLSQAGCGCSPPPKDPAQ
jgi:hypothetical protein